MLPKSSNEVCADIIAVIDIFREFVEKGGYTSVQVAAKDLRAILRLTSGNDFVRTVVRPEFLVGDVIPDPNRVS